MSTALPITNTLNPNIKPLSVKQLAFVSAYIMNGFNGAQACRDAGYTCKTDNAYAKQASALLRTENVVQEISYRLQQQEDKKIADANEILQFYTSVMRGEILDQFGIEASLDTRIKAANEMAKHKIEIPLKLEQKNITNNIGSITLNFIPRNEDNSEEIPENFQEI